MDQSASPPTLQDLDHSIIRRWLSRSRALARAVLTWVDVNPFWLGIAVFFPCLLEVAANTYHKKIWFDEIFTLTIANFAWFEVIDALKKSLDNQPPFFYWLTHLAIAVFGQNGMALRFFPAVGFLLFLGTLFRLVGRRYGWLAGAAAVSIVRLGDVRHFGWDGRPYGVVLGAVGVAGLCWFALQEERSPRWALPGFWLGLALAGSCHYTAILAWIPFAAAQCVHDGRRRAPDWRVWLSLGVAAVPWLIQISMMYPSLIVYRPQFWAVATAHHLSAELGKILDRPLLYCLPVLIGAFLLIAWRRGSGPDQPHTPLPPWETVFIAASASAPFWVFAIAQITKTFELRYMIHTVFGWGLLIGWLASRLQSKTPTLLVTGVSVLAVMHGSWAIRALAEPIPPSRWIADVKLVERWNPGQDIVVLSGGGIVEASFHASPEHKSRFVYLLDHQRTVCCSVFDTPMIAAAMIAPYLGLRLPPYDSYLRDRNEIWLWQRTGGEGKTWILHSLLREGWAIQWEKDFGQTELLRARRGPMQGKATAAARAPVPGTPR